MYILTIPLLFLIKVFENVVEIVMRKHSTFVPLSVLNIDPESSVPIYRQLYTSLRNAILSGQLASGTQLPSTRTLALEIGVARGTILNAYEQLLAEGYVEGEIGGGTYVARKLPDELLRAPSIQAFPLPQDQSGRSLSQRGIAMASTAYASPYDLSPVHVFRPGLAALDAFPVKIWSQITARRARQRSYDLLNYGDPAGYMPLRQSIAGYLRSVRAVKCDPEQMIIVTGSQQALDLTARVLLDTGDDVLIEDPCYPGAKGALLGAGAHLIPVSVDKEGMRITSAMVSSTPARMAYVTPSHQYPLGVTMSLARRLALLEWARSAKAWILEDDYDSEFRYKGRPLAALQGLDTSGRVIYIGTFSKVLFPALRIGYMVVPPDLVDGFVSARTMIDLHTPTLGQVILTDFLDEGHFGRHIRRMRELYAGRQAALVSAVDQELKGLLEVSSNEAGMYLIGWLLHDQDDQKASEIAAAYGIEAPPLSTFRIEPGDSQGLLLGYTAFSEDEIRIGVQQLAEALQSIR
jgi:GntR family transcriptional regulator / MocR family aminotransferase